MLTHCDRIFVNKNTDVFRVNTELLATPDTWSKWFMVNRSLNTSVGRRSYAEVLKNTSNNATNSKLGSDSHQVPINSEASTSFQTAHSNLHCVPVDCVPQRISHKPSTSCKVLSSKRNSLPKGQPYVQEFSLPLQNRYEALQSVVQPQQFIEQHDSFYKTLQGNKNKTGKKLGTITCCSGTPDGTYSTTSKGNKNKTGNKLGQVPQEVQQSGLVDHSEHQVPNFRGNKNGPRAKLGLVLVDNDISTQCHNDISSNRASHHTAFTKAIDTQSVCNSTSHDLACVEERSGDDYVYLYDVSNSYRKRKRNIPDHIYQDKFLSSDYVNCVQQNGKDFGFLPLNNLMVYTGDDIVWSQVPNIVEAHTIVRNSKKPNFMGARIPVASQFNIQAWNSYLDQYWDKQITDLLQFGFPLDFDRSKVLESTYVNHSSALKFPDHVQTYIETEQKYKAILGPFQEFPFHCHVSPFLTRDKPNSNSKRVILDLSFPQGKSANDGVSKDVYLNTFFELNYPSVDTVVHRLKELGSEALLYKIDISRAFRHIRIDPGDLDLLGLKHDQLFLDCTLPFGFRHGSVFFQRCTDAVRYIMKKIFNFPYLCNYIDDLIYTGLPHEIQSSYTTLIALLQELGLEISQSKLVPPTTNAVCLGIEIDTVERTLQIPVEKLSEIHSICQKFASKSKVTKNQLQSLLGSLLYITKCIKPARFFLNRMLQLLREHTNKSIIHLCPGFHRDLNWFNTFLFQFNGVTFFDYKQPDHTVYLDACLTGFGGVFADKSYALQIPLSFKNYTIVHLEILNIVVALKIWGDIWKNQIIDIRCDNMAVVEVLNSGKARDPILATCARNIWLLTAIFNIQLTVTHIPGVQNTVADLLSRWEGTDHQFAKLSSLLPNYDWMPVHLNHTHLNEYI